MWSWYPSGCSWRWELWKLRQYKPVFAQCSYQQHSWRQTWASKVLHPPVLPALPSVESVLSSASRASVQFAFLPLNVLNTIFMSIQSRKIVENNHLYREEKVTQWTILGKHYLRIFGNTSLKRLGQPEGHTLCCFAFKAWVVTPC